MRQIVWVLTFSFTLTAVGVSPALAASRSKTVTVSCVVAPQIGLISPRPGLTQTGRGSPNLSGSGHAPSGLALNASGVKVTGNLEQLTRLKEETRSLGGGRTIRLFTVTAL